LDVWIDPTAKNAARVMNALRQFGAPLEQVSAEDFSRRAAFIKNKRATGRAKDLGDIESLGEGR
jgi:hypothetical protein